MCEITTPAGYLGQFQEPSQPDPKVHEALRVALETRRFEIELYWKRTTYFWALIGASLAGYVAIGRAEHQQTLQLLFACLGLVLSAGWYLANRGSKYWQENWERHVDLLEDEILGPLFKTTISASQYRFRWLCGGYRYSVSGINQIISIYVMVLWFGLAAIEVANLLSAGGCQAFSAGCGLTSRACSLALVFLTVGFVVMLFACGKSHDQGDGRVVHFHRSELKLPDGTSAKRD